jgi:type IV secretory pathway VirB2 component (pilin)
MWVLWGLGVGIALSLVAVWLPDVAFAQNKDWVKPAENLIGDLTGGLVQIGIPVVGLGVIILGIWAAISGRIDWMRMGMILVAGILITLGPSIMSTLLG